jgi:hypothetical protein
LEVNNSYDITTADTHWQAAQRSQAQRSAAKRSAAQYWSWTSGEATALALHSMISLARSFGHDDCFMLEWNGKISMCVME